MQNYSGKSSLLQTDKNEGFIRLRLNTLLAQSIKKPLTIVCAGMGCGKTQAVHDFSHECGLPVVWVHLSGQDNDSCHFWDSLTRATAQTNISLTEKLRKLGFPSTEESFSEYFDIRNREPTSVRYLLVFDGFHILKNAEVLRFLEREINNIPENRPVILISREFPQINISSLTVRDNAGFIFEDELNFTESELSHYLLQQGLSSETNRLTKIYKDTKGWAFIINFAARMLKKTPGYSGYVQSAIKQNIFQLIEAENWNTVSERLRRLFLRLSLTDHRSAELVDILAGGNEILISELKQQNAFIRFDKSIDYYYFNHLFMDFLSDRQSLLSDDEVNKTYRTIADWCMKNDFIVDALLNYEKIRDYELIVSILFECSTRFLMDNVKELLGIFQRINGNVFDTVEKSAAMHVQLVMNSGNLPETVNLLNHYEKKYLKLPENSAFRNRMLGCIYYQWAILRSVLCTADDRYDFDVYYSKAEEFLRGYPVKLCGSWYQHPPGMWTCLVGCNRSGAPQEFLEALIRSKRHLEKFTVGLCEGLDFLCQSELLFYKGYINQAESDLDKALEPARKHGQFEIIWRALFYKLRIAVYHGDYSKVELVFKSMDELLEKNDDSARFLIHDIIVGWYRYSLDQPEQIPGWLKERFTQRVFYTNSTENFSNNIKSRYYYLTRNYAALLDYIAEKKQRSTILFEKIELLAMEACAHYKMKDKESAFRVLQEAYDMAQPCEIVTPFIELGKDMRLLINAAAGCAEKSNVPLSWLKSIKQKVTLYCKNQAHIKYKHRKSNEFESNVVLTPRETDILHCLCEGLSRSEIADKYDLSVNTIKVHINNVYIKLNAHSRADIYRIAVEQNLV